MIVLFVVNAVANAVIVENVMFYLNSRLNLIFNYNKKQINLIRNLIIKL